MGINTTPPDERASAERAAMSRATVASELGVSIDAVKRLQRKAGRAGERVSAPGGGSHVVLSAEDVAALRAALTTRPVGRAGRARPAPARPAPVVTQEQSEGWREALAEARAHIDAAEARADKLADELAQERAARLREVHARMAAEVREGRLEESRERWRQWARLVMAAWSAWRWWRRPPALPPMPEALHDGELAAPEG